MAHDVIPSFRPLPRNIRGLFGGVVEEEVQQPLKDERNAPTIVPLQDHYQLPSQ